MSGREVTFYFGGRRLRGVAGEPLAKALFRNGIRTLSHSVKYKRPRSIHCARGRCVMCHMEVDGVPGVPTCITPLEAGMRVRRESFRPFFAAPLIALARKLRLPAGFYYRSFTRPALVRKMFMGSLRRMAGVGRLVLDPNDIGRAGRPVPAPALPGTDYDVVVVGAGLSGMAAALAGAERGAKVLLLDEYAKPGGHALGPHADGELAARRDALIARLRENSSIDSLWNTSALGFYAPNTVLLGNNGAPAVRRRSSGASSTSAGSDSPGRPAVTKVRADTLIFATGAYDVIPLFQNNDLPGVFGPRAIRLLLERDGLKPGRRAVVYGTGGVLDSTLHLLGTRGIEVVAVVDPSSGGAHAGSRIENAKVVKAKGRVWIEGVDVIQDGSGRSSFSCDLLCTAFEGQGAYELPYQAGFTFELTREGLDMNRTLRPTETSRQVPGGPVCFVVGEAAGTSAWREKAADGEEAGRTASQSLGTK